MHRFIDYISDLLFLHDCVIIPGFGGFICNYKNAYIDEQTGMIYPPSKDILFNKNLKHNDGLVVNWISTKENISYAQASKQLELFVEDLKVTLNQGRRIVFGDIGIFYTDRRFNTIFETGECNFLADTYGMERIESFRLSGDTTREKAPEVEQIRIPRYNEMSPYLNMQSRNRGVRLMKYGVAAMLLIGVVVGAHLISENIEEKGYLKAGMTGSNIGFDSGTQQINVITNQGMRISPDYDYVNYDPLEALENFQ